MNRVLQGAALIAVGLLLLAGCASGDRKQKFAYVERPVEQLYQDAAVAMERKRYDEAIELFGEVERQHPYSAWARRAMLMKAFASYQQNDYEEAVKTLDQFIQLHPGNKDASYAYYLRAMSFFERIRDVGRDQEFTNNTVSALNDVLRRYPETDYARDARLKLDLAFDQLAGKEMEIGRYYLKNNKHIAAINRFRYVVDNYERTSHVAEALYRLTEANLQIGVVEEARAAAAVLGYNYPGSDWYQDAYRLMSRNGLLEPGSRSAKRDAAAPTPVAAPAETASSNAPATIAPPADAPDDADADDKG